MVCSIHISDKKLKFQSLKLRPDHYSTQFRPAAFDFFVHLRKWTADGPGPQYAWLDPCRL